MFNRAKRPVGFFVASLGSAFALLFVSTRPAPAQVVRQLPPSALGPPTTGQSIDALGRVVGYMGDGGVSTPMTWQLSAGAYVASPLALPAGQSYGGANSIGAGGAIAGYTQPNDLSTANATVWTAPPAGSYAPTPLLAPAGSVLTDAYSTNAAGAVAGYRTDASDETDAVVWEPVAGAYSNVGTILPSLAGWNDTAATAVNDSGDLAGYAFVTEGFSQVLRGAVWESQAGGGYAARQVISAQPALVTAMNNFGTGAGVYDLNQPMVMVAFEGDYYAIDLPTPFGANDGASNAVNNHDALVGYLQDPLTGQSGSEAALWLPTDDEWAYINLDQWLNTQAGGASWILQEATGISDNWLVTGYGRFNNQERGFVLDVSSLVPEPSSAAMLIPMAVALLSRRRSGAKDR